MVFRATASISWNMLLNKNLTFEEVKVLFTENIIYNFIELMTELKELLNANDRFLMTDHINEIARDVLEFLGKQYPQTKI